MSRSLPPTAGFAEALEDGRLFAPSAARNQDPITQVLRQIAPKRGRALEIASGTGQHIIAFAQACPGLIWVPTDVDVQRLASIQTYVRNAQLSNLSPPLKLDATAPGWSHKAGPVDLIVLVNLLHLISDTQARTVVHEICSALAPGATALIYGPFLRDGETISDADAQFHATLREADPKIGYKDARHVIDWAAEAGAPAIRQIEMPANNIAFILSKPE